MSAEIVDFKPRLNFQRVEDNKVVTLKYALFDADNGELIEYRDNLIYLHGSQKSLHKLQDALQGLEVDMKTEVLLSCDEAFGPYDPTLLITDAAEHFPPEAAKVNTELEGQGPDGEVIKFRVTKVEDGMLTVDGNHPLAGKDLRFVVEIMDIRDATSREIEAGCAFRVRAPDERGADH